MDKKANRDKRKKNLSYKPKRDKDKESEKETSQKPEKTSLVSEDILPNNWSKYEIKDNDVPEGADFETLLQEPVCNNSHFKFKSEQNWDADINSQLGLNKYFTLDLKLLSEGISTVPFPKRHNFNENLFTYLERESIKKHSEINNQKYKKFLEKKFPTKNINITIKKNLDEMKSKFVSETSEAGTKTIEKKELKVETNESKIETNESKSETSESKSETNESKSETNETESEANDLKSETNNSQIDKIEEYQNTSKVTPLEIKIEPKSQRERKKHENEVDELLNLKDSDKNIITDELEVEVLDEDPLLQPTELPKVVVPQATVDLEQWLDDILDD